MSYDKLEDVSNIAKGLFFSIAPNLIMHKLTCDDKDCQYSYKELAKECLEASKVIHRELEAEED